MDDVEAVMLQYIAIPQIHGYGSRSRPGGENGASTALHDDSTSDIPN